MSNISPYKVLFVDLSTHKIWDEKIPIRDIEKYIGARGLNAKLLWDLTDEKTRMSDATNPLIFGAGTLTGTHAPSSGRVTVTSINPNTGLYLKSSVGGHWGSELKYAGYSNLVVLGKCSKPSFIFINNDVLEIRDASYLWGKDVRATVKMLQETLEDTEIKVACIGPAGENLVAFGCIMFDTYSAAGRGGLGKLMGLKKLKAIVVRGNNPLKVHEPIAFNNLASILRHELSEDTTAKLLSEHGTAGIINGLNRGYALPTYNFQQNHIEGAHRISGEILTREFFLKKRLGCGSCGIGCKRYTRVDQGEHEGAYGGGPEYETISALGSGCGILDMPTILKGNEICNILGMDTISAGSVIQWAMECTEKGILSAKDTDGIDLIFGNGNSLIQMLTKIAYRDGFGDVLADGLQHASKKVGGSSWQWAVQAKGLEQSFVEVRQRKGYALAFAVNLRGPDHLMTQCVAESARTVEGKNLIVKICGNEKYANPSITEKRGDIVRWHEDCYAITDCLGICSFATTYAFAIGPKDMAELFQAATGMPITEELLMRAGRRIITLEKAFNVLRGADRSYDKLPWRMMNDPIKSGPMAGARITQKTLDKMLDDYYNLHGWDKETSWPKAETLEYLDLQFVTKALGRTVRLDRLP